MDCLTGVFSIVLAFNSLVSQLLPQSTTDMSVPTPRPRPEQVFVTEIINHQLGDTIVSIEVTRNGNGPVYVSLHNNETTSTDAASGFPGTHVTLRHPGIRYVEFKLNGQKFKFDPNRIFTSVGIEKTLLNFTKKYPPEAEAAAVSLAQKVLSLIEPEQNLIIALHNNSNKNYSVLSYQIGESEEKNFRPGYVSHKKDTDPDDFFFTTSEEWYQKLFTSSFNVALQSDNPTDDGSLSVYCATRCPKGYINVEAEKDHLLVQNAMLRELLQHFAP